VDADGFEDLLEFLRDSRGFDFTGYKRSSLMRRTSKRMQQLQIDSYPEYLDHLQANAEEFEVLFNTILINVTSFFRDPPTWEALAQEVVPKIVERAAGGGIRIWSAGCASGEEPFSIAMLLAQSLGRMEIAPQVKIYATDIDEEALAQARAAQYDPRAVEKVPEELRERFFDRNATRLNVRKELRRAVIFGRHNLAKDPPISRIDLLLCRNTLMYFNAPLQARILDAFHFALRRDGFLSLGKSEVMLSRTDRFEPIDLRRRIFRPVANGEVYDPHIGPVGPRTDEHRRRDDQMIYQTAFDSADFAQLVLDRERRIVTVNRTARQLFGLDDRDLGKLFQDVELSYRPVDLRSPLDRAESEHQTVGLHEVVWSTAEGETYWDVTVAPLMRRDVAIGTVIIFSDVTRYHGLEEELELARRQVQSAYEELQSTVEELETTNEELQSTNEELETTNEELQSTNEELETMNEELQSTNEELETMNDELRMRSTELNQLNFFFESVLMSLQMGVIVTDPELRVQVWNEGSVDLWGLRGEEVAGQHLMNLDFGLPVDRLRDAARLCLSGRSQRERLTIPAVNRRGRQIVCEVSVVPLSERDEVRGVIILVHHGNGAPPGGGTPAG
jgi:two-component system CheB/CheR fusion protein